MPHPEPRLAHAADCSIPAPVSIPPLTAALSRRRAIFGVVTLAATASAAAPARASNDAQLGALADEICETLDGAAYALDPVDDEDDQNHRLRQAERLMLRMVDIPAVGL